jgi:hypothetical protein
MSTETRHAALATDNAASHEWLCIARAMIAIRRSGAK